jgi:hypothetical protein
MPNVSRVMTPVPSATQNPNRESALDDLADVVDKGESSAMVLACSLPRCSTSVDDPFGED